MIQMIIFFQRYAFEQARLKQMTDSKGKIKLQSGTFIFGWYCWFIADFVIMLARFFELYMKL